VENDLDGLFKLGVKIMSGQLVANEERVRHDPNATAAVVLKLAAVGRARRAART
jgi:hypothetical protein